jgi:DNA polymerase-3 subunit delta
MKFYLHLNININQLIESFKPTIFWKEKNIIKEQLKRWSKPDLKELLDKIFDIEIQCKKNYDVSTTILQNFMINISTKKALTKSPLH